jgi:hypothetical protein
MPDWIARAVLLLPIAVFATMWIRGGQLAAPTPLLTAVSLLAGGMLSAFTHLSTLRLKLTDWATERGQDYLDVERAMLDETAAHLLTGSLACGLDAAVLVIGMNLSLASNGHLTGFWAAAAAGLSTYILAIFIMIIPRLYSAWVEINGVSPSLSGFTKTRRR